MPQHKTDAICRIQNVDRYDDRDDIRTNLIESYDRLMEFVDKHLNDMFYIEGSQRIDVRNKIAREIVSNLLMHREFRSGFPAKLIIEKDKMWTENANKAKKKEITNIPKKASKEQNSILKNKLTENEINILGKIDKNPSITQKEISENIGISVRTVGQIISKLKEKGVIKRIGSNKNGKWEIKL